MAYIVPFKKLKDSIRVVASNGRLKVDMNYDELVTLMKALLGGVAVDETFYRETYPDVAEAIAAGTYQNAKQHFVDNGYFEGRRPFAMDVDEAWYVENNPDVAAGLKDGTISSAKEHFLTHGYVEGRAPRSA